MASFTSSLPLSAADLQPPFESPFVSFLFSLPTKRAYFADALRLTNIAFLTSSCGCWALFFLRRCQRFAAAAAGASPPLRPIPALLGASLRLRHGLESPIGPLISVPLSSTFYFCHCLGLTLLGSSIFALPHPLPSPTARPPSSSLRRGFSWTRFGAASIRHYGC